VHNLVLEVPSGYSGCTSFEVQAYSWVIPQISGDGSVNVVEVGVFKVSGKGEYCNAPVVPTTVDIYDRSPGQQTYHVRDALGARQDVAYRTVPAITMQVAVRDTFSSLPGSRFAGTVAIEFRAPDLGVCLMDVWAVATVASPVSSFVPCPVVEP